MLQVLIVENNPTTTRLLTYYLEDADCDVIAAGDGLEALGILENSTPDIIITDVIMPRISGDQLCKIIRQDRKLSDTFLVVHSSIVVEDTERILDLDADIYIAKGTATKYQEHIQHVLDQFHKGTRKQKKIVGAEGLHRREITTELLLARRHSQTVFENITDAVFELDQAGTIVQVNRAALQLVQKNLKNLLGSKLMEYLSGNRVDEVGQWFESLAGKREAHYESDYADPLLVVNEQVLLRMVSLKDEDRLVVIAIMQNITQQKSVERKLAKSKIELEAMVESIDYGVLFMDRNLEVRFVNRAFREMWNITEEQVAKRPYLRDLIEFNRHRDIFDVEEEDFDAFVTMREDQVRAGAIEMLEMKRKDGKVYQYQCVVLPDDGRLLTYYDITEMKSARDELAEMLEKVIQLANHDPLTKLANLRFAKERIQMSLAVAERKGWQVALLFIDLDGFKMINDSYGHETGDAVLQQVAQRLTDKRRKVDTIARIGGDEFIILQTEVHTREDAAHLATDVIENISQPIEIEGTQVSISASVGIALYPDHGKTQRVLISKADNAMYRVKNSGKSNFAFADDS